MPDIFIFDKTTGVSLKYVILPLKEAHIIRNRLFKDISWSPQRKEMAFDISAKKMKFAQFKTMISITNPLTVNISFIHINSNPGRVQYIFSGQ